MSKEKRETISKSRKNLDTIADFLDGIEKSIQIEVHMKDLEPQFRAVMTALKDTFEDLNVLFDESVELKKREEQKLSDLQDQLNSVTLSLQTLEEENRKLTKKKRAKVSKSK